MNIFRRFTGGAQQQDSRLEEISEVLPLSQCSSECESCSTKFPSSVKVDLGADIYNSAKPTDVHLIIPTGKKDWAHDATSTPNTVENAVAKWKKSSALSQSYQNIKVSTSSLPVDILDPQALKGEVNDILILPFFCWVRKIKIADVAEVLDELIPKLYEARESETSPPTEVLKYKITKDNSQSYIFLCSHTTRDKRCGVTAPLMKKEMDNHLRDLGYYRDVGDDRPNGVQVQFINHVGGHKYAANVIIYLRSGEIIWLAKCTPRNAVPIIDETVLNGGRVWPDLVRVVQKDKAIDW